MKEYASGFHGDSSKLVEASCENPAGTEKYNRSKNLLQKKHTERASKAKRPDGLGLTCLFCYYSFFVSRQIKLKARDGNGIT